MTNSPPSSNPANAGSLSGALKTVLDKFARDFDTMIPARVVSFDRQTNRATIQPMVVFVSTEGDGVERKEITNVPVYQASGGGFVINFPLEENDLGWLHASDKDISLFKQSHGMSRPNTFRQHSFEDSVFYPDTMRGWVVDGEGLLIQTLSGNQRVRITDDEIIVTSDNKVTVEAANEVVIDTPLTTITGNLQTGTEGEGSTAVFGGTITAQGEITTLLKSGISLSDHIHNGVMPGSGNTGEPIA